jgi:hypothetical protein
MTVGELKKILSKYPDEMEILTEEHSDYVKYEASWIGEPVVMAVDKGGYVMRAHPTMSEENKRNVKEYLFI